MKKLFVTASIVLASLVTFAQEHMGGRPQMDPAAQTEKLAKDLGLSDDQKAKISPIISDAIQQRKDARAKSNGDRNAFRESMKTIEQNKDAQFKTILTDEQFKKYQQLKEELKARRANGGAPGNGAPQGE